MADSRGSNPISQLWIGAVSPEPDSECLYEEISGLSGGHELDRSYEGSDGDRRDNVEGRGRAVVEYASRVEEQYVVRGSYGESGPGAALGGAATLKLTRGPTARYVTHHYQYGDHIQHSSGRSPRHHLGRGSFSNETQEEIQEDDEATLRELLVRYVNVPSTTSLYPILYQICCSNISRLPIYPIRRMGLCSLIRIEWFKVLYVHTGFTTRELGRAWKVSSWYSGEGDKSIDESRCLPKCIDVRYELKAELCIPINQFSRSLTLRSDYFRYNTNKQTRRTLPRLSFRLYIYILHIYISKNAMQGLMPVCNVYIYLRFHTLYALFLYVHTNTFYHNDYKTLYFAESLIWLFGCGARRLTTDCSFI